MSRTDLLELRELTVQFGGLRAVDSFDFKVQAGEFVGLIGPNGSGKTTVFNAITGVVPTASGDILFEGASIQRLPPNRVATLGVSRTFQNIRLFPRLSVKANVALAVHRVPSYSPWEAFLRTRRVVQEDKRVEKEAEHYLSEMGLTDHANREARTLPYGLQRKLEITRALATNPKLLLLDEPAAGMNEQESYELGELLIKLHEEYGLTIVLIEHHMSLVAQTCKRATVINVGRKLAEGGVSEIKSNRQVIEAYLGERRSKNA